MHVASQKSQSISNYDKKIDIQPQFQNVLVIPVKIADRNTNQTENNFEIDFFPD